MHLRIRELADHSPGDVGKIWIEDVEYEINQDFQQGALQLADALDLDELEAAVMFHAAQEDSQVFDRPPLITAIMRFHEHRHFLLECVRLVFLRATEKEPEPDGLKDMFWEFFSRVLDVKDNPHQNASMFARKGLVYMEEIEKWLLLLNDQVQKASIVGQEEDRDIVEAIEFQRHSLMQQHESLGAILFHVFDSSFLSSEDLRVLITHLKKLERFDGLLIHYIPLTIAAFVQHGSPEGGGSQSSARDLHSVITTAKDGQTWKLSSFHAAVIALWLSVYSGWYFDDSPVAGVDLEKEAEERTKLFMTALDDGGLDFMLAICNCVNSEEWADPARSELVQLLLRESVISLPESISCSDYMKQLLMENFEVFVESCIANMPDAVRKLKSEEDVQRLDQLTALRDGLTSNPQRGGTHLESLLMVMSFAFEHRPEAAQEFWADPDGNLYGFVQWASKRQTVPRVSAFCEMLCSISEGEENAEAANKFLSEEDKFLTSKLKRSSTMNWTQMFAELSHYASRIAEKPSSGTSSQSMMRARKPDPVDMSEPESPVMLTCYLRLMGHLCKQSSAVREWMLQNTSFKVLPTLMDLCNGPIPGHLRATAFATLSALMTDKCSARGNEAWSIIDVRLSTEVMGAPHSKPPLVSNPPVRLLQQAFQRIGEVYDQVSAFVVLLNALITPASDLAGNPLSLPYPESLGGEYRMPGIEPYIDFVLGHALARKIQDVSGYKSRLLTYNCLEFVVASLRTFNEELVTLLSQPHLTSDTSTAATTLVNYIRLHPFARVMEWLFNEDVLKALFAAGQQEVAEVAQASSDSVLVLTLLRSVEVMNLIMDLQSTYFNIVRPIIKTHAAANRTVVANSSLASFEDSVLNNLTLVPALCLYCGTGHEQLTVASLTLLEKLTSSRKLNKMSSPELMKWQSSNKIVEVLASEVDIDSVSRSLVSQMIPEPRELEYGPEAAGYVIREGLLALLNSCLAMVTDRPTVAHLLLGFTCVGNVLDVASDGLLANRMSLLHAIIGFLQSYPDEWEESVTSWTVHLKRMAFEVLKHLWSSKLATYFTLGEMRAQGFLMNMFASQTIVGSNTRWNGVPMLVDEFWVTDASSALAEFLLYRSHLFAYAATEIRSAAKIGSPTLQTEILSTLLGNSALDNGESINNPSVFDLFDFADLNLVTEFNVPELVSLDQIAVDICAKREEDSLVLYNLAEVEELIQVRKKDIMPNGSVRPQDEESFQAEAARLKQFIVATNQSRQIQHNRYLALRAWAELITTIITCSVIDDATRATFTLHAIQLVLPKLEVAVEGDSPEAIELARLAETLISRLTSDNTATPTSRSGDVIDEKLHQLFQVSARGITLASGNVSLREVLYSVCSHYITRITTSDSTHDILRRHTQQVIRSSGPRLIETVCDDACIGQEGCRAAALLLLNGLAVLDSRTDCVLAEMVSQSNYLTLFLDAVRSLPVELRNAEAAGKLEFKSSGVKRLIYFPRHCDTSLVLRIVAGHATTALSDKEWCYFRPQVRSL